MIMPSIKAQTQLILQSHPRLSTNVLRLTVPPKKKSSAPQLPAGPLFLILAFGLPILHKY